MKKIEQTKRGKDLSPVSFWVSKKQLTDFKELAKADGMTLSAKIRSLLLREIKKEN